VTYISHLNVRKLYYQFLWAVFQRPFIKDHRTWFGMTILDADVSCTVIRSL